MLLEEVQDLKAKWGKEIILLAHHYQRHEIADLGDRLGDSYELARAASEAERARFIVFCGVRFMAEAAEIVRRENQVVIHPAAEAGCPLADMAPVDRAEEAWEHIAGVRGADKVMPLVYMNSSAKLKAMVGRYGGSVCTSSNAGRAFEWGFKEREAVFFFPDEHLGRNSARGVGIPEEQVVVWDPKQEGGGIEEKALKGARAILWKGYCHVHTAFVPEDIQQARERFPEARVLVHPECPEEVVKIADGAGSTAYLVKAVENAEPGSTLVIGTEINLVSRLARDHHARTVIPLKRSLCPNMFRISAKRLLDSLRSLPEPEVVTLPKEVKKDAKLALERMLSI
jgi:quinolinate synthase